MTPPGLDSPPRRYLIVGACVFGVSTALHLKQTHPASRVTLLDRTPPSSASRPAASWDWNKVIRADYKDPFYCGLALESQDAWKTTWKENGMEAPSFVNLGADNSYFMRTVKGGGSWDLSGKEKEEGLKGINGFLMEANDFSGIAVRHPLPCGVVYLPAIVC